MASSADPLVRLNLPPINKMGPCIDRNSFLLRPGKKQAVVLLRIS